MRRRPLSHLLVLAQLAGIVLCCYPVGLVNRGPVLALVLCALGSAAGMYSLVHNKIGNFSVYPEPKRNTELVTSGPYRFVRHPMYSSLVVMMIGIALYNLHLINFVGLPLVALAVFGKALIEERLLA